MSFILLFCPLSKHTYTLYRHANHNTQSFNTQQYANFLVQIKKMNKQTNKHLYFESSLYKRHKKFSQYDKQTNHLKFKKKKN